MLPIVEEMVRDLRGVAELVEETHSRFQYHFGWSVALSFISLQDAAAHKYFISRKYVTEIYTTARANEFCVCEFHFREERGAPPVDYEITVKLQLRMFGIPDSGVEDFEQLKARLKGILYAC